MGNYTNNYVFKAIDSYPYDLEETIEALNYALSYDDKNTMALTLMGRVYAEKLSDYDEAIAYYKRALAEKVDAFEVYEAYIAALLNNEEYKEAERFIDFALTVKGSDKAMLYLRKAVLYEQKFEYKTALGFVKEAKIYTYNESFMYTIDEVKTRIKGKMPKKKKKSKKKKAKS